MNESIIHAALYLIFDIFICAMKGARINIERPNQMAKLRCMATKLRTMRALQRPLIDLVVNGTAPPPGTYPGRNVAAG
jgi:hypothetical protein